MRYLAALIIMLTLSNSLFGDDIKNTRIVIYNNGFGIVQETRDIQLKKGIADYLITDVPQTIEVSSVKAKIDARILEQNFQYDLVSMQKILNKYIDSEITLIPVNSDNPNTSVISGILLSGSSDEIILQKKDGGLSMIRGLNNYQLSVNSLPEGFITKPTLLWKINSPNNNNQDIDVTYKAFAIGWEAQYVALLNDTDSEMALDAWVSLTNNSGKIYKNADVQLIAGDINTVNLRRSPAYAKRDELYAASYSQEIEETPFFDYHLYNLSNRTTIANNETKQVSMFSSDGIKVSKNYIYESFSSANIENQNPSIKLTFTNSSKNQLGMPFPKGKFSIYKKSDKGNILLGEDVITHTAKDENIKLTIGKAFDIVIDEIQTDYKQLSKELKEFSGEISIRNRKEEDIEISVVKQLWGESEILFASDEFESNKNNYYEFKIKIKKGETHKLKYTYRIKSLY